MSNKKKIFIVSKNIGGIIKNAVPEHFNLHICKDYEKVYDEYLKYVNPNENHLVILDNREEDELLDLVVLLKNNHPHIKIIFMFSPLHKNTAVKAVKLGIKYIISKPFFDGDLTDKIEEVVR